MALKTPTSIGMAVTLLVGLIAAGPATRPVQPAKKIATTLPSHVSRRAEVPLVVTLTYDSDEQRTLSNYAFDFIILDETGNQIAHHPFYREAIFIDVPMSGRQPEYKPRLVFDPYLKSLKIGVKYQLITVVPSFHLAHAVWFVVDE